MECLRKKRDGDVLTATHSTASWKLSFCLMNRKAAVVLPGDSLVQSSHDVNFSTGWRSSYMVCKSRPTITHVAHPAVPTSRDSGVVVTFENHSDDNRWSRQRKISVKTQLGNTEATYKAVALTKKNRATKSTGRKVKNRTHSDLSSKHCLLWSRNTRTHYRVQRASFQITGNM